MHEVPLAVDAAGNVVMTAAFPVHSRYQYGPILAQRCSGS